MSEVQGITNNTSKATVKPVTSKEYTTERKNNYISFHTKHGTINVTEELLESFNPDGNLNSFFDYYREACSLKLKNGITISLNDISETSQGGDANIEVSNICDSVFITARNADYLGINAKNGKQENIYISIDDSNVKVIKDEKDIAQPRIPMGYLEIQ